MRVILVQHSFWVVVLHTQKDLYTNLSDQIWGFILWLVSYCFYWCTLTLCLYAVHKPVIDMSFSYNKSVKSELSGILWRSLWWCCMQNVNRSFDRIGLECISGISMSIIITKMTCQNLFQCMYDFRNIDYFYISLKGYLCLGLMLDNS